MRLLRFARNEILGIANFKRNIRDTTLANNQIFPKKILDKLIISEYFSDKMDY